MIISAATNSSATSSKTGTVVLRNAIAWSGHFDITFAKTACDIAAISASVWQPSQYASNHIMLSTRLCNAKGNTRRQHQAWVDKTLASSAASTVLQ